MKACHHVLLLAPLLAGISALGAEPPAAPTPVPPAVPAVAPPSGRVKADDHPTLQAAVDALGEAGGEVLLGARNYPLKKTVLLRDRVRLQGVMDSKVMTSVTVITAAPDFEGEWMFETVPDPARSNPDLNKDIFLFDLNLNGAGKVSGIRAFNADGMRLERCRLANLKDGILVTQVTDLPKPWHWNIAPGAVFINNCIFRCDGTAIRLEYTTQNRIYANWFVSGGATALHLKNSDKTWFVANEINTFSRAGIVLEDDRKPGNPLTDLFLVHNWIHAADPAKKYLECTPPTGRYQRVQFTNNILMGKGSADTAAFGKAGNRFADNVAERPGLAASACGQALVKAGAGQVVIEHGLYRAPEHVGVTFRTEPPKHWVAEITPKTFTVRFAGPVREGSFSWNAVTGD